MNSKMESSENKNGTSCKFLSSNEIGQYVSNIIKNNGHLLDVNEYEWFRQHVVEPKQIKVTISPYDIQWKEVWLITDEKDSNDSLYKIAFNKDTKSFGLIYPLDSEIGWYMGDYGNLIETIKNM